MHSHYGLQAQLLMTAPLIIHDDRDKADQQEVVIMLADFSFTPPERILEQLRMDGHRSTHTTRLCRRRKGDHAHVGQGKRRTRKCEL